MFEELYLRNEWTKLETVKELIRYFCIFYTENETLWKAYRHFKALGNLCFFDTLGVKFDTFNTQFGKKILCILLFSSHL